MEILIKRWYLTRLYFRKKVLNNFLVAKVMKKRHYVWYFWSWVVIGNDFYETNYMYFLTKDEQLLKKYNEIWDKVRNNFQNGFDSQPVYVWKYVKTKTKTCESKINKSSHDYGMLKEAFHQ